MTMSTRLPLVGFLLAALGCGVSYYQNTEYQTLPISGMGGGLPEGPLTPDQAGLNCSVAYVWDSGHPPLVVFRFWPDGKASYTSVTLASGERLDASHADNLVGAILGCYTLTEEALHLETFEPEGNRWEFKEYSGYIADDGSVRLTRSRIGRSGAWASTSVVANPCNVGILRSVPTW
jgi:hypothetical protein